MIVGINLKTYFGHARTLAWAGEIGHILSEFETVASGLTEVFVAPSIVAISDTVRELAGSRVALAAQDMSSHAAGPYTGESSGAELHEVGVRFVILGHAERRANHNETDISVAQKANAAFRHGLTPVVCVGEAERTNAASAAIEVAAQLVGTLGASSEGKRVIVAYEPVWAIGAPAAAPFDHVREVQRGLRDQLATLGVADTSGVIYGGAAGPGTLTNLGDDTDGVFLGRFVHEPRQLRAVLREAEQFRRGS